MRVPQPDSTMGDLRGSPSEDDRELHHDEFAHAVAAAHGAHELVEELHAVLRDEREDARLLRAEVARLETEIARLRSSRLFRYTASIRAARGARPHGG